MRLTRKLRWLRAVLGSALALHLGFAQAGMAHRTMDAGAGAGARAVAQSVAAHAAAPCHTMSRAMSMGGMADMPGMAHDTGAAQAGDTNTVAARTGDTTTGDTTARGTQHSTCCDEGLCHCAATSGFGAACASILIGVAPRTLAPRFATHATSQAQPARELRPPISR